MLGPPPSDALWDAAGVTPRSGSRTLHAPRARVRALDRLIVREIFRLTIYTHRDMTVLYLYMNNKSDQWRVCTVFLDIYFYFELLLLLQNFTDDLFCESQRVQCFPTCTSYSTTSHCCADAATLQLHSHAPARCMQVLGRCADLSVTPEY